MAARKPKVAPVEATSGVLHFKGSDRPQPWIVCSKDDSRPALMHPWLERIGPRAKQRLFLCASDSYSAVRAPVELRDEITDKPIDVPDALLGLLPINAMQDWAKGAPLVVTPSTVRLKLSGETREIDRPSGTPANMAKITKEAIANLSDEFTVGFNPDLLAQTAKAMGAGGKSFTPVVMRFQEASNGHLRPFILTAQRDGKFASDLEVVGVLMPVRLAK